MKIYIILFLVGIFGLLSVSVYAQTDTVGTVSSEVTLDDLEVENPGILPSNPFYFLKEWRRGIRRFFTFDSVKRAELELNEANERAAEIKRVEEIDPQNVKVLSRAVANYQENIARLKIRLEALKETSENPNVDKLLDKLVDRSLQHQELFDGLREKLSDRKEIKEQISATQEKIGEIVSQIPQRFESIEAFQERVERRLENITENASSTDPSGLRAIKKLELLKENLPVQYIGNMDEAKNKLKARLENRLENTRRIQELGTKDNTSRILNPIRSMNNYLEEKRDELQERNRSQICPQVITPAISPEGVCKEFSTSCDVPPDWKIIERCELNSAVDPSVLQVTSTPSTGNVAPASQ